jgi:hypothetical protein
METCMPCRVLFSVCCPAAGAGNIFIQPVFVTNPREPDSA